MGSALFPILNIDQGTVGSAHSGQQRSLPCPRYKSVTQFAVQSVGSALFPVLDIDQFHSGRCTQWAVLSGTQWGVHTLGSALFPGLDIDKLHCRQCTQWEAISFSLVLNML